MSKRILIVEDHSDVRRLIRMSLEMGGYDMREVGHADAALLQVQRSMPDLILLDVCIEGPLNGIALCRRWRADPALRATRIVMLTSMGNPEDLDAAREAGADAYMLKPFSPMQLVELVGTLCAGSEVGAEA